MELLVTVGWTWGGAKTIRTSSAFPILEVLSSHGFSDLADNSLLDAHRGRLVNPLFTFDHHKIQSGDRLVCLLKRRPDKSQLDEFRDNLSPTKRVVCQVAPVSDPGEAQRRAQIARLNDLSFIGWEVMPDFPLVMHDLLKEQEEQTRAREIFAGATVLTGAMTMSESPLPTFFQPERVYKFGPKCPFVKDLSDQPRLPSHLDPVKKSQDGL
jgi:hypothetical protein